MSTLSTTLCNILFYLISIMCSWSMYPYFHLYRRDLGFTFAHLENKIGYWTQILWLLHDYILILLENAVIPFPWCNELGVGNHYRYLMPLQSQQPRILFLTAFKWWFRDRTTSKTFPGQNLAKCPIWSFSIQLWLWGCDKWVTHLFDVVP
jgi:hypothetical protein